MTTKSLFSLYERETRQQQYLCAYNITILVVITRNTVRSFPNGHRNVSFVLWLDHKKTVDSNKNVPRQKTC